MGQRELLQGRHTRPHLLPHCRQLIRQGRMDWPYWKADGAAHRTSRRSKLRVMVRPIVRIMKSPMRLIACAPGFGIAQSGVPLISDARASNEPGRLGFVSAPFEIVSLI